MNDNENLTKEFNPTTKSNEIKNTQSEVVKPPKENLIEATDENFETLIKAEKPTLVDFWAEWCAPCKQIGPILEEISKEMSNEVTIAKHNIDEEPNTPTKFGVRGIPTMLFFKSGELKATKVGATTKSNIVSWIKENI